MENIAASSCKASNKHYVATDFTCSTEDSLRCMPVIKSVGSIENFKGSCAVVCRMLFDYCMEVIWNAVFYDTVREYSSSWRKEKLWSGYSLFRTPEQSQNCAKRLEKLPDNVVSFKIVSGFILLLLFVY